VDVTTHATDAERSTTDDDGPVRVFLLDDHELVRHGLRDLLEMSGGFQVVGEAGTVAEALARIPPTNPDVAVVDVQLPDGNGIEVCREVRSRLPHVACLILTSYSDDEALFDAIMAGAAGYVLKQIRENDLVGAIRQVAAGRSLLDPRLTAKVLERLREGAPEDERLAHLTDQERRILSLVGEGLTNRQIGERIHLAEKTVKNYMSSILAKLGMERRTEVAALAARLDERAHRRIPPP
jgi:DNA-binding NarL/FixJ family response regulator